MKHSVAPWKLSMVGRDNNIPSHNFVLDAKGEEVCQLFNKQEEDFLNQAANAKLIAAAPDLLEVVSAILLEAEMRTETGLPQLTDTLIQIAKSAIKKATA